MAFRDIHPSSKQLRIAICTPELKPLQQVMAGEYADATYIIQGYISSGLGARGHKLTFVAPENLNNMVCTDDLQKPTYASQTWSASSWFDLASKGSWHVQKLLGIPYLNFFSNYRRYDACMRCLPGQDLVYERHGLYKIDVAMACKHLGIPYVLFFEADEILEHDYRGQPITGILRWRAKNMIRYNLTAADCIICVSKPLKEHLVTNWEVPEEKVIVLSNGVDVVRFQPDPEARSNIRASLGLDNNPVVLFVGSFYEWHDVKTLLDAFAKVLISCPEAHLVLVGDGTQRQIMMQHAADLGIQDVVHFTGLVKHSEVPHMIAAADIAVAPVTPMMHDLWLSPLKLYEYMASGTSVIASKVGQLAEVINDNRNGLLVPPGDVDAMAEALNKLIGNPSISTRLGMQARQDAINKYSWEQYMSCLERVFSDVIKGKTFDHVP